MKHKRMRLLSILILCALLLACLPTGYAADRIGGSTAHTSSAASLLPEARRLTDSQAEALHALSTEPGQHLLAAAASGKQTAVQERDWSKYASKGAKYRLSGAERTLYELLDKACLAYLQHPDTAITSEGMHFAPQEINFADLGLTVQQVTNVFAWFSLNNPQYFFTSGFSYGKTSLYVRLYDFVSAFPDAGKVVNEMFDKLDGWIADCNKKGMSTWEKVCLINKKLCENTVYSPDVTANGVDAVTDESQTIYSLLMLPDTVCAGYADTFTAMASALGIEAYNVHSEDHRWNVVRFEDGQYYMVDVTWDDKDAFYMYNYIGVGTDFMAKDDPDQQHTYLADIKAYAPAIPKTSYCGYGRMVLSDGTIYTGGWKDGGPEGYGRAEFTTGAFYDGEWSGGKQNGIGLYSWPEGDYYEGLWTNGERTLGLYTWPSGGYQMGGWKDGKPTGWGIKKFEDGTTRSGQWLDGSFVRDGGQYISGKYTSGTYIGEVSNDLPNGFGRMVSNSGDLYIGQWSNGKVNGHGKYQWANGTVYIGDFQDGKMSGTGTYLAANGNVYAGEYRNNLHSGSGKFIWNDGSAYDGDVYIGTFRDDAINGVGTYTWSNGNLYQGQFLNEQRDGWGKFTCRDGSQYDGDTYAGYFQSGSRSGYGTYIWADGTVYEGEWQDNVRNGCGIQIAPNGQKTPGKWSKDAYVEGSGKGFATKEYTDCTYYGELKDGQPNGYGRMEYKDGKVYAGMFQDGLFQGSGAFVWEGGLQSACESYLGEFAAGERCGQGTYTWTNGNRYDGTWKDGEPNGTGTMIEADGDVYTGDWLDGQRTGTGTLIAADGTVYDGQWLDGQFVG